MAIQPGRYDFQIQRRADHGILLQFKDSEEVAINLTGWTVVAQAWNMQRSKKYEDFTVEYVDRPQGKVRLRLSYLQTTGLATPCQYDVLLINPAGLREYYVEGTITASEGYTVAP